MSNEEYHNTFSDGKSVKNGGISGSRSAPTHSRGTGSQNRMTNNGMYKIQIYTDQHL